VGPFPHNELTYLPTCPEPPRFMCAVVSLLPRPGFRAVPHTACQLQSSCTSNMSANWLKFRKSQTTPQNARHRTFISDAVAARFGQAQWVGLLARHFCLCSRSAAATAAEEAPSTEEYAIVAEHLSDPVDLALRAASTASNRHPAPWTGPRDPRLTPVLAIDCEMVGVGADGSRSVLAQVCVVNERMETVYLSYVKPKEAVTGE
jgi:hypothetical protein